jgi:hypothetical protein
MIEEFELNYVNNFPQLICYHLLCEGHFHFTWPLKIIRTSPNFDRASYTGEF